MACTIVIPLYTCALRPEERQSLRQCQRVLGQHDIVVVHPAGLQVDALRELLPTMRSEAFEPHFFRGIEGYNRLMLSADFYRRFAASEYILIYQTDAWVFADTLDEWCERDYDYIGAPWLGSQRELSAAYRPVLALRRLWAMLTGHGYSAMRKWRCGNGGLSLRRPLKMVEVLEEHRHLVPQKFGNEEDNEDVFFSIRLRHHLRVPQWEEAMHFAVESRPAWALQRMHTLPFGCHGWNKPPHDAFWRDVIKPC